MKSLAGDTAPHKTAQKVGIGLAIGGGVLAAAGIALWIRGRRQAGLRGVESSTSLGDGTSTVPLVNTVKKGGMVLKHRRKNVLPIKERVGIIQDLVWESVQDPQMRELALAITGNGKRSVTVGKYTFDVQGAGCTARDGMCEARAVYNWVRKNIRYTGDVGPVKMGRNGPVEAVDLFQGAKRTIEFGGGDCDDADLTQVVLLSSLTTLNGIHTKVRWAQENKHLKHRVTASKMFADWGHIYPVVGMPKTNPTKWVPIDSTLPGEHFGYEVPHAKHQDFAA